MGKNNNFDDVIYNDYTDVISPNNEMPKMFGDMLPQFHDNYEAINITETRLDLHKKATTLVDDICNVYYQLDDNNENSEIIKYLNGLKIVETMNLKTLLLQVKTSEHLLYSLLDRLNATGSVDNGLYRLIVETQEKTLNLTMLVSQYIRSLPTYFKSLKFELETNVEMVMVDKTQEMIELETDDPDNFIKKPQQGMRSFLKHVAEMESEMLNDGENIDTLAQEYKKPELDTMPDLKAELLKENE